MSMLYKHVFLLKQMNNSVTMITENIKIIMYSKTISCDVIV